MGGIRRLARKRIEEGRRLLTGTDFEAFVDLGSEANRRLMMLLFGSLCVGASIIGTIVLVAYAPRLGLSIETSLLRGLSATLLGLVALAVPGSIPMLAVDGVVVAAVAFISFAVSATPQPLAGYLVLFYFWPMIALVVVRSERAALVHFGLIAVAAGATFALDDSFASRLMWWGTVLIALGMVWQSTGWLVGRARVLALAERRARARAEETSRALRAVSEKKARFLAATSHELRTPLNAVVGFAQLLRREAAGGLNETQASYADDILDSGRHLIALIDDTLDDGSIASGQFALEAGRVTVGDLVDDALRFVREQADGYGITLDAEVDGVGAATLDERKIRQVLVNLLSNAVKFTPRGGTVSVSARRTGRHLELTVTDTGPGIHEDHHEAIFNEFSQVGPTSERAQGTGLGLAVARALVELHAGEIRVDSRPGEGARFTVRIPHDLPRRPTASPEGPTSATRAIADVSVRLVNTRDAIQRLALSAAYVGVGVVAGIVTGAQIPGVNRGVLVASAVWVLIMAGVLLSALRRGVEDMQLVKLGLACSVVSALVIAGGQYHVGEMVPSLALVWIGIDLYVRLFATALGLRFASAVYVATIGVAFGLFLAFTSGHHAPALQWLIVMGTLGFASVLIGALLRRLGAVATAERVAAEAAVQATAELEEISRHQTQFLAGMSHELRTPLNAVIGFAQALDREIAGPLTPEQRVYVRDIIDAGTHLLRLINDVLDLAKIEAGRLELQIREVDLAAAIDAALAEARDGVANEVDVVCRVPRSIRLHADEPRLVRAVAALASNAIRFSPDGCPVTVAARVEGDDVAVTVTDVGPGIDPSAQEDIFEPFHHGDTKPTQAREGVGLGLALAQRLIQLHGGRVTVDSELGAGATFTARVPLRPRPFSMPQAVSATAGRS